MPSYRVTLTIGALAAGVPAERVLPTARDAAAETTTVEAADIGVVAGRPRITVRFTADDAPAASRVAARVLGATRATAVVTASSLTHRVGGRWYVVR